MEEEEIEKPEAVTPKRIEHIGSRYNFRESLPPDEAKELEIPKTR